MNFMQNVFDNIEKIKKTKSYNEIYDVLNSIVSKFGFDYFTYARIFPKSMSKLDLLTVGNYPVEWLERYHKQNYLLIDPAIKHCTTNTLPFNWQNISDSKDPEVINFSNEGSSFGLREGFSLGLKGNSGEFSLISLGGIDTIMKSPEKLSQAEVLLHSLLPYFHEHLSSFNPVQMLYPEDESPLLLADQQTQANKKRSIEWTTEGEATFEASTQGQTCEPLKMLTLREKECLLWTAEGKTAHELAIILSISDATVNFHLKNATRKLDCSNKTHAVAKAILLGLNGTSLTTQI